MSLSLSPKRVSLGSWALVVFAWDAGIPGFWAAELRLERLKGGWLRSVRLTTSDIDTGTAGVFVHDDDPECDRGRRCPQGLSGLRWFLGP